jgi:hypothetical protein
MEYAHAIRPLKPNSGTVYMPATATVASCEGQTPHRGRKTMSTANANYGSNSKVGELPILVGILAVLLGLFGVFLVVVGLLILLTGLGILAIPAVAAYSAIGGPAIIAGLITLIFGAVIVAVASGLWDLETWALYLTGIVLAGIIGWLVYTGSFGISLLISVVLIIYLIAVSPHFY